MIVSFISIYWYIDIYITHPYCGHKVAIDISIAKLMITGHAAMNWMPGCSGVSYSRCLLEEAVKFLPVKIR